MIYLAHENEVTVVDLIPLSEVDSVICSGSEIKDRSKSLTKCNISAIEVSTGSNLARVVNGPVSAAHDRPRNNNESKSGESAHSSLTSAALPPHPISNSDEQLETVIARDLIQDGHIQPAVIQIRTLVGGFNSGRTYYLRCSTRELSADVAAELRTLVSAARRSSEVKTRFLRSQEAVRISSPFFFVILESSGLEALPP